MASINGRALSRSGVRCHCRASTLPWRARIVIFAICTSVRWICRAVRGLPLVPSLPRRWLADISQSNDSAGSVTGLCLTEPPQSGGGIAAPICPAPHARHLLPMIYHEPCLLLRVSLIRFGLSVNGSPQRKEKRKREMTGQQARLNPSQ